MIKKKEKSEYEQKLIEVARVARVVKGGKRFSFRTVLVIGNRKGKVGVGIAKGADVSDSMAKAVRIARKNLISVKIVNDTIPHEVRAKYGRAVVMLKPAPAGHGIVAGGVVRAVVNLAGIKNITAKILGSPNKINNARATILALQRFKNKSM